MFRPLSNLRGRQCSLAAVLKLAVCCIVVAPVRFAIAEEATVLKGHAGTIRYLRFSPDGKSLVSSSEDATTRVWDVDRAKVKFILPGKVGLLSHDGRRIATVSGDGLRTWDRATGKLLGKSAEMNLYSPCAAWSSDDTILAFCPLTEDRDTITICDAKTLKVIRQVKTEVTLPLKCAFSPQGKLLAVGGGPYKTPRKGEQVVFWDADSGQRVCSLPAHDGRILSIDFSPGGKLLASAGQDGMVRIWNVPDFAAERARIAKAAKDKAMRIFELIGKLDNDDFTVREAATKELASLGRIALTALEKAAREAESAEARLRIKALLKRMPPPQRPDKQGEFEHRGQIVDVAFAPDGKLLASVNLHGRMIVWDISAQSITGTKTGSVPYCGALAFAPNGEQLVYSRMGELHFLQIDSMRRNYAIEHFRKLSAYVEQSDDGTLTTVDFTRAPKLTDKDLSHLGRLVGTRSLRFSYQNTQITDAGTSCLAKLSNLEILRLGTRGIGDETLSHLAGLTELRELYLSGTDVTDAGLQHLGKLEKLRLLTLSNTKVSDKGLKHLAKLKSLETLHLTGTKVTAAGVQQLKKALSAVAVSW